MGEMVGSKNGIGLEREVVRLRLYSLLVIKVELEMYF